MKLFKSSYKFQMIIFFLNFFLVLNNPSSNLDKNNFEHLTINTTKNSMKKLSNEICNIKNCLVCKNRNECIKCKGGYELDKKRCYSTNCHIYGFCKFCDEYDCLKCMKGFKLNYGICDEKEVSRKKLYFIIFLIFSIFSFIIYICIRYKKIAKLKITTGQVIKFIHPKSGFYQLHYEVNNNILDNSSNSNSQIVSHSSEEISEHNDKHPEKLQTPIVDQCVICGNKSVYTIADCGCSLCLEHYKIIKRKKIIKCKIHNVIISSSISFKMAERSKLKGNALEKLGLQKCPICKINASTQSFNCGCSMRVCEKCFNDNVYVFKYNQCPGCGKEYNPIKITTRWNNKNSYKKIIKNENELENGGIINKK